MLLIAVFALAAWLFWLHSARTIERLNRQSAIYDETNALSREDKTALAQFEGMFKDEFGMRIKIRITKEPVVLPGLDSKTIFLGICPSRRQVLIELPPLVRRALGDQFLYALQGEHFKPYFDSGEWTKGLLEAIAKLWRELSRMEDTGPAGE